MREIPDEKYIVAGKPDKERLARYLNEAKGFDRTMRDFALLCGVEPSTFSRVVKQKITRPLKESVIQAVYINSADEDIDYDRLMRANGMYKEESEEDEFEKATRIRRDNDISVRNTITNRIEGLRLPYISSHRVSDIFGFLDKPYIKSRYGLFNGWNKMSYGFKDQDPQVWLFYNCNNYEHINGHFSPERGLRDFFGHNFTRLFLLDEWEPECLENIKLNFVFSGEDQYSNIKTVLSNRTVNSSMSLILIDPNDPDDMTIVEEFTLERRDGKPVTRFIDIKGRPAGDSDDDDWDEKYDDELGD